MDPFTPPSLTGHSELITGIAVLENGNLISVSLDKTIIVWSIRTWNKVKIFIETSEIWSVSVSAFSNDSFATGNRKGDLKIWSNFSEHKPIRTLTDHNSSVLDLTVLNNGCLVSASLNGSIRVWDKLFQTFKIENAHSKATLALKVLNNGSLISGSQDKTIRTWNTNSYIFLKNIP